MACASLTACVDWRGPRTEGSPPTGPAPVGRPADVEADCSRFAGGAAGDRFACGSAEADAWVPAPELGLGLADALALELALGLAPAWAGTELPGSPARPGNAEGALAAAVPAGDCAWDDPEDRA
ncbi:hypothetical protein AB0I68_35885 [Streptomyces sp. NPDC050448]|uniref:hypothetical protein n=1 Tax=Streptomyces sp. NPDC050448 TaxID=3155404 RepID=UPI00342619C5